MEADLNVPTEQWMGNSFRMKSIVRIIKAPHELTGEEEFECYRVLYVPEGKESSKDNYMFNHYELEFGDNPQIFSTLEKMNSLSSRGDIQSEFQVKVLFYELLAGGAYG
ncbi:hypothetical protein J4772_23730 [Cohnella sp. LGH]|uniref:hypothetical protein n=1 Tax=Cohnella sp. LGH TaxID=1619153 RepID=UPI001ADC91B8|nr:hypothetical protein [Cohnella sp. LGH]QTH40580.1 hypothetical protein J4772_23730 [Cohnella sp. LGH]